MPTSTSLDFNYFSFSNCNINPNATHLAKHQILSPNHQFSQRIWYVECYSVHAHMAWSQKFRLTPVIQPPTLLWNVLFSLFLLTTVVQNVCVCIMDFVSASKNTIFGSMKHSKWARIGSASNPNISTSQSLHWSQDRYATCAGHYTSSMLIGQKQPPEFLIARCHQAAQKLCSQKNLYQ